MGFKFRSPFKMLKPIGRMFRSGSSNNPAQAAQPFLNRVPEVAHQAYDPYVQQGQKAGSLSSDQFDRMTRDPAAFMRELMGGYSESPGYQLRRKNALTAAQNSAAAGGFLGTQNDQMNREEVADGILGADIQQYLSNALSIHSSGLQGLQGKDAMGYDASSQLGGMLGSNLSQQAGYEYMGQASRNATKSARFAAIMQMLGQAAGAAAGGMGGGGAGAAGFGQRLTPGAGTVLSGSPGNMDSNGLWINQNNQTQPIGQGHTNPWFTNPNYYQR